MNCHEALEWLLEAGPDELAGVGDSPAAAHLRSCARCTAAAARLLEGQHALAASLDGLRPRLSADEALDRVLGASPSESGVARAVARLARWRGGAPARPTRLPARWRRWAVAAALPAAAAGFAALLLTGDAPPPAPLPVSHLAERTPALSVPAGRNAAVFTTSNPRITVVWYY